jgi:hypothetical protein
MFFFEKQSIPYPRMTTRKKLMGDKTIQEKEMNSYIHF